MNDVWSIVRLEGRLLSCIANQWYGTCAVFQLCWQQMEECDRKRRRKKVGGDGAMHIYDFFFK